MSKSIDTTTDVIKNLAQCISRVCKENGNQRSQLKSFQETNRERIPASLVLWTWEGFIGLVKVVLSRVMEVECRWLHTVKHDRYCSISAGQAAIRSSFVVSSYLIGYPL